MAPNAVDAGFGPHRRCADRLRFAVAGCVAAARQSGLWNIAFVLWVFAMGLFDSWEYFSRVGIYGVCALGAIGMVLWGVQEQRRERINLGIAGFAITIIAFYFSNVMDKLGRSASLVGFGLLFLLGGWQLEQLRRRLVARTTGGGS